MDLSRVLLPLLILKILIATRVQNPVMLNSHRPQQVKISSWKNSGLWTMTTDFWRDNSIWILSLILSSNCCTKIKRHIIKYKIIYRYIIPIMPYMPTIYFAVILLCVHISTVSYYMIWKKWDRDAQKSYINYGLIVHVTTSIQSCSWI